jgi:surfactin family lipopeptide synthetase B
MAERLLESVERPQTGAAVGIEGGNVATEAIHRAIELQTATRPDGSAFAAAGRTLSYRQLNQQANALARHLIASGLVRGSVALVRMPRSPELVVVLLAVLKAGAAYAWIDPDAPQALDLPASFCIVKEKTGRERQYLALDLTSALRDTVERPSPNLPILSRGTDIACVLPGDEATSYVLVPHATVTELASRYAPRLAAWDADPGAFGLWQALMTGATVTLGETPHQTVAA